MRPSLVDLARQMIAIDSVTTRGTRDVAEFCAANVLAGSDLDVRLIEGEGAAHVNLLATKAIDAEPPILLNSHLDTVPPGDPSLWTRCGGDPFAATLVGEDLFGLGTADAKLDWLCKALALLRFDGRRFARGVIFAATFGEERGLRGARALVPRLPRRPIAAWVGEPTELEVVTRHKGLVVVKLGLRDPRGGRPFSGPLARVRIAGRSAHASTPGLGENAILGALRRIAAERLRVSAIRGGDASNKVPATCEFEGPAADLSGAAPIASSSARLLSADLLACLVDFATEVDRVVVHSGRNDADFSPPTPTWNLGMLHAADGRAELELDFRLLPGDSSNRLLETLGTLLSPARREHGVEASLEIERDNSALDTPSDSQPVAWSLTALAERQGSLTLRTKAGCTEAGVYAAAGIPSVVFGPGRAAGNIHAPNEHVSIADLEGAVDFYARLIERVCLS